MIGDLNMVKKKKVRRVELILHRTDTPFDREYCDFTLILQTTDLNESEAIAMTFLKIINSCKELKRKKYAILFKDGYTQRCVIANKLING